MTKNLNKHIYNLAILVIIISFLKACSSTRIIYTFVENYIKDEIIFFFYLSEEEEILLSQHVSELVAWHRTSMLPMYSLYLNNIADKLQDGQYGADDIEGVLVDGQTLVEKTVIGLTPYASRFLINYLTDDDIEFMEKRMLKRRQERIEELSKPEKILYKQRLDRLTSNFERFLGNLTDAQVFLLEAYTRETLNDSKTRLHNRTLRQKAFVRYLRTQPNTSELVEYMNKLLLRGHLITNPSFKAFSIVWLERFRDLLINILAISSKSQRDKIIRKLRDYAYDFQTISGD
tara:strand:+ start:475 stop:1341 length:867 start_codon:yes stop_codon:yes gene_type:complete